jgi:Protein of unknown function (DUF3467)
MEEQPTETAPIISDGFTEDFEAVYANQFHFEISAWDLKVIHGQLDQTSGKPTIDWHTSVTMTWAAAKMFSYLIALNVLIYESNHGHISLHPSIVPPPLAPPTGDQDTEQNREFYTSALKLRKLLLDPTAE